MKFKSFLIPMIVVLFATFIALPTKSAEYKTAPKFVRYTTNALGYNFIAKHIAQKIVVKSLNKSAKGNYKVHIDSFSGVDLKKGKFRGVKIHGENIVVDNEVFVSKLDMKTTSNFNYIKYNKKPLKFMTDIPMEYTMELTDEDFSKMFSSNKFIKTLSEDIPLVKIDRLKTSMSDGRITFSSRVKFPFCKPVKCSISTGLKVEEGKIVFDNIDTSSLKSEMAEWVLKLMNSSNFLTNINLYIFDDTTTILEIKNIKISEGKMIVSGNVTIKKA